MYRGLKYNGSGCLDMTAYRAIKNINKEKRKNFGKSKIKWRESDERSTNLGKSKS